MIDTQQQLQNALTTTFLANLVFLSEYDKDLYYRIDELSRMIENGNYQEKYALDFVLENGNFDIYDIINDKYLYNKIPNKYNKKLVEKVKFDESNSIFTLESLFSIKTPNHIDFNVRFDVQDLNESNLLTQNDIFAYTSSLKDFLNNKKKRLKEIKKFVFIGTLLGRHIPDIVNKIDADIYLVCERNLEIFRLSLFVVDYTILAKNKGVIFSIMDSVLEEEQKIFNFLSINPFENYLIKFSTTGINIDEYIDKILSLYMGIKPTSYDYNRYLYTFVNRSSKNLNTYKTLLLNQIKEKFDIFNDKPVLFLAAGPSLDENIEWIKKNQNKFIIVTIGAAYKKLLANNIRIDMIFTLDEQFEVLNKNQFDDKSVSLISENTIIMASVITDYRILEKFNQKNLFLYEVFIPFHKNNISVSGFSVGEITLFILLNMNVKNLYLIGLDMALNKYDGNSHSIGNEAIAKYDLSNIENDRSFFGLREGVITVKGNLEDEVKTTSLFHTSIKYVQKFLAIKDIDVNVYNVSLHGAYFENSIPTNIDEIKIEKYKNIDFNNKELLNIFEQYSTNIILDESKQDINKQIDFLKDKFLQEFEKTKSFIPKNYKEFFDLEMKLISLITDYEFTNSSIAYILRNYLQIIFPYFSYHFNDLKVKNENKKVNKIKINFEKQIGQIIEDYLSFLEKIKG